MLVEKQTHNDMKKENTGNSLYAMEHYDTITANYKVWTKV